MLFARLIAQVTLLCSFHLVFSDVIAIELEDKFTKSDAVLISKANGDTLLDWQSDKLLIPASLTKLLTAQLAINKWGLKHRFHTEFYFDEQTLWVKGFGDPYLVSEEFDLIAKALLAEISSAAIKAIAIDNSYFNVKSVPGQSSVADPYNAPVSAVAVNFNTVSLLKKGGEIKSAEPQTPLTAIAAREANALGKVIGRDPERVNLRNANNAQQHFAELLALKLGASAMQVRINQSLPDSARLLYRHFNSHTLEDVLRGALKYSNNFIANQVFLKLVDTNSTDRSFAQASNSAMRSLINTLAWRDFRLADGSGLSRDNRLNAQQLNQILNGLAQYKTLLKPYDIGKKYGAQVYAKTGTLNDVRSFAGFIKVDNVDYQFVFMFNRAVPWRYREQLLERVIRELAS